MLDSILNAILTLAKSDPDAKATNIKMIEDVCKGKLHEKPRKLILRKDVLNILGVSAPTLRKDIKSGLVNEIKLSSRKRRFYYDEVISFAENGEIHNYQNSKFIRNNYVKL